MSTDDLFSWKFILYRELIWVLSKASHLGFIYFVLIEKFTAEVIFCERLALPF